MSIKTPNQNVVLTQNTSTVDEITIPANTGVVRLGQYVQFHWDIGESDMRRVKINEVLLQWRANIDAQDNASVYTINTIWAFVDTVEVLVNNKVIHETNTNGVNQQKLFLSRLQDKEPNSDIFLSVLSEEMEDHDIAWQPHVLGYRNNSRIVNASDPVANGGEGYLQSNHVERFFNGIFENLPLHRIKSMEIRMRLKSSMNLQDVNYFLGPSDDGRANQLPIFRNMELRIRHTKTPFEYDDPIPQGSPMVLYSHRYEEKVFADGPFNSASKRFRVNLKQSFSTNKRIQRVYFFAEDPAMTATTNNLDYNLQADLALGWKSRDWSKFFQEVAIIRNGEVLERYVGTQQIQGLINKQLLHEHGHPSYIHNQSGTDGTRIEILARQIELPYYSFLGLTSERLTNDESRKTLIVGGKSNADDNWEIELVAKAQNTDVLRVIVDSLLIAEVYSDRKVTVSGK